MGTAAHGLQTERGTHANPIGVKHVAGGYARASA